MKKKNDCDCTGIQLFKFGSGTETKRFVSTTLHFMITYVVHSKVCNGQVTYRVPTYIMLIHVLFKQTTTA